MNTSGEPTDINDEEIAGTTENRPKPENFNAFLPWACGQLIQDFEIGIINSTSKAETSRKPKTSQKISSKKQKASEIFTETESVHSISCVKKLPFNKDSVIKIHTTYDNAGNLIQLKFDNNKYIPRKVLKIISLIAHFHKLLSAITINKGLNKECLYELTKLVSHENITDLCLDNTLMRNGGYDILLETRNNLRNLSLARCGLGDEEIIKIARNLTYPLPASLRIQLLNLTSNSISDVGAKHLATAIKTNRTLIYLNLSDNAISDEGAGAIFDALKAFPISHEDVLAYRTRNFRNLKDKENLIAEILTDLKTNDSSKANSVKKRGGKPGSPYNIGTSCPPKKGKDETDSNDLLEKAKFMAETKLGKSIEPFSPGNTFSENDLTYCKGNNYLAYLNLSYNKLSYISVKNIESLLLYQKELNRKPRGLVRILIEGNCIPNLCPELIKIDSILSSYLQIRPRITRLTITALRGKKT